MEEHDNTAINGAPETSEVASPAASPRIGDTRPAPAMPVAQETTTEVASVADVAAPKDSPAPKVGDTKVGDDVVSPEPQRVPGRAPTPVPAGSAAVSAAEGSSSKRRRRRGGRGGDRKNKSTGRYLMCVHVDGPTTHIAMLEGRSLVEYYVVKESDETTQIDGNLYLGRVQNVLPGMEAAFVDIGIPKNAVLYRGDVRYESEDSDHIPEASARIEDVIKPGQLVVCQVTKNPIGAKGARLTQEVSLPGRFVVLVPNSSTIGISKRLGDGERRRLRKILDEVRPAGHGLIVRTAAEGASAEELAADTAELSERWAKIESEAKKSSKPGLLYRELELAVRMLREELTADYRGVIIDDRALYEQVKAYVSQVSPELTERVEYYDPKAETLPVFERYFVHEQLHKALDTKVWLPSGGSLIIERTEALTVIDVNTGKNVGTTNLEETVFKNNLEAADEVARQLRLRDIGGIIVIDFIDMESKEHRSAVANQLRAALSRDKTRTQVFDISELGLVEMTRKRISEGLIESVSVNCAVCEGRGIVLDPQVV
jgi:ribonuclease E